MMPLTAIEPLTYSQKVITHILHYTCSDVLFSVSHIIKAKMIYCELHIYYILNIFRKLSCLCDGPKLMIYIAEIKLQLIHYE